MKVNIDARKNINKRDYNSFYFILAKKGSHSEGAAYIGLASMSPSGEECNIHQAFSLYLAAKDANDYSYLDEREKLIEILTRDNSSIADITLVIKIDAKSEEQLFNKFEKELIPYRLLTLSVLQKFIYESLSVMGIKLPSIKFANYYIADYIGAITLKLQENEKIIDADLKKTNQSLNQALDSNKALNPKPELNRQLPNDFQFQETLNKYEELIKSNEYARLEFLFSLIFGEVEKKFDTNLTPIIGIIDVVNTLVVFIGKSSKLSNEEWRALDLIFRFPKESFTIYNALFDNSLRLEKFIIDLKHDKGRALITAKKVGSAILGLEGQLSSYPQVQKYLLSQRIEAIESLFVLIKKIVPSFTPFGTVLKIGSKIEEMGEFAKKIEKVINEVNKFLKDISNRASTEPNENILFPSN